jgi:predicted phosphoadenosine phosphosulfate sulfurtransferase
MVQINEKVVSNESCYDLSIKRVEYIFDSFDYVTVSFSGGKDSTVCLNLCLEVARKKNRLPLNVFTFDEECIPPETVDYMERISDNPDIDFKWYCVPIKHRNACSRKSPYWNPWDPDKKAIWVRELPAKAITHFEGFKRVGLDLLGTDMFPPSMGTVALVMGIRSQESLTRHRMVAVKHGFGAFMSPFAGSRNITKAYPIYDWLTPDVWVAPELYGWDYNHAYDVMQKEGVPLHSQRCAPPFGEQPIQGLGKFKTCWPELWSKMTARVPGAATAARYARTELYGNKAVYNEPLPEGMTWARWTVGLLAKLEPEARVEAASVILKCIKAHKKRSPNNNMPDAIPDKLSGFCWRFLIIAAKVGGDKFGRIYQLMGKLAIEERAKNGIYK